MKSRYLLINLLATPLFAGNFFAAASSKAPAEAPEASRGSSIEQMNLQNTLQPISASATVSQGWTVDASLLYWNARSDGYIFGQKAQRTIVTDPSKRGLVLESLADTKTQELPFDTWDPGVQLGVGYIFPQREQWITRFGWTHLKTDSDKSLSTNNVALSPIIPSLVPFLLGSVANKASADWHLRYDILDAEMGRQFFVGKWLALKPVIGLRGGWINQHFKAEYGGVFDTNGGPTYFLDSFFKSNQELGGVGLRIGSDAKFYMGECWSLLGNLSTSILWTSIEVKQNYKGYHLPNVNTIIPTIITSKDSYKKLRSNLEGQLGLQWQTFYHHDHFRFAISALYTFSYWFGLNQLTNLDIAPPDSNLSQATAIPEISNGDLQLQGVNIKFDFDF